MNMYNDINYINAQEVPSGSDITELQIDSNVLVFSPSIANIDVRSIQIPAGLEADPSAAVVVTFINTGARAVILKASDPLGTGIKFKTRNNSDFTLNDFSTVRGVIFNNLCFIEAP
jgi:hypothetical protein